MEEIQRTPFSGKGEPEKLRGDLNGKWSRRINLKDRLVYEISDEAITVTVNSITAVLFLFHLRNHY